jgi:hypothetical protein
MIPMEDTRQGSLRNCIGGEPRAYGTVSKNSPGYMGLFHSASPHGSNLPGPRLTALQCVRWTGNCEAGVGWLRLGVATACGQKPQSMRLELRPNNRVIVTTALSSFQKD